MQEELFHRSVPRLMGTALEFISLGVSRNEIEPLWERILAEGRDLERMLDRFSGDSEVSRLNRGEKFRPSAKFIETLEKAEEYRERTCGLFDVRPDGRNLDFGGFAKGLLLEEAEKMLLSAGVRNAFVNFGGSSILALGAQPGGDCWMVGVVNPWGGPPVCELALRDEALSTSGNSPGYSGHILNPLNGKPATGRILSTAVCAGPLDAEVLSTALSVAGGTMKDRLLLNFPEARCRVYDLSKT